MIPPVSSSKTQNPSTPIVGVVVAGGASSRFGSDKALAKLGGRSLVERAFTTLRALCSEVIVADAGRGLVAGADSVADGPGSGPAAAILGAALHRRDRSLLVLACDLPLVPLALLDRIAGVDGGDWVLPRHGGGVEPLCALWRPRAIDALSRQVDRGELALHRLEREGLDVRYLDADAVADLGDPRELFANVNSPDDLRRLERAIAGATGGSLG
jgi:molybdopterin-guanine dinucleotide biosynthesis protein A